MGQTEGADAEAIYIYIYIYNLFYFNNYSRQVESKYSQVKTRLVLWIFILIKVTR